MTVTKYCDSYQCTGKYYVSKKDYALYEVEKSELHCPKCGRVLLDGSRFRQTGKRKKTRKRKEKVYDL